MTSQQTRILNYGPALCSRDQTGDHILHFLPFSPLWRWKSIPVHLKSGKEMYKSLCSSYEKYNQKTTSNMQPWRTTPPFSTEISNNPLHTQTPHVYHYRNAQWENCWFPLLVYLWVGSTANLAGYSYQYSLLYQNHTAGWMSQGSSCWKGYPADWGKKKKKQEWNSYTKTHSPQGQ